MKKNLNYVVMVWIFLGVTSCSIDPVEEVVEHNTERIEQRRIAYVGQIATINAEERFVLILVEGASALRGHSLAYVEEGGRRATLKLTGEALGKYVAADLFNGSVEKGDRVFVSLGIRGSQNLPTEAPVVAPTIGETPSEQASEEFVPAQPELQVLELVDDTNQVVE